MKLPLGMTPLTKMTIDTGDSQTGVTKTISNSNETLQMGYG